MTLVTGDSFSSSIGFETFEEIKSMFTVFISYCFSDVNFSSVSSEIYLTGMSVIWWILNFVGLLAVSFLGYRSGFFFGEANLDGFSESHCEILNWLFPLFSLTSSMTAELSAVDILISSKLAYNYFMCDFDNLSL